MIAIDTNLLVYAHRSGCPEHKQARLAKARDFLASLLETGEPKVFLPGKAFGERLIQTAPQNCGPMMPDSCLYPN